MPMASTAVPPTLLQQLAVLLRQPDERFRDAVVRLCDAPLPIEAAQQLGKFLERLRDLTTEELQELFAQTFPRALSPGTTGGSAESGRHEWPPEPGARSTGEREPEGTHDTWAGGSLVDRVAAGLGAMAASGSDADRARQAGRLLAPMRELIDALGRARNPYVHAVTALYLILLIVAAFAGSPPGETSPPDGTG